MSQTSIADQTLSWENDLGERDLNLLLHQDPFKSLQNRLPRSHSSIQETRRHSNYMIKPNPKAFKSPVLHLSKEKLDVLSIEDLKTFQKKKIRFTSAFSLSSPYIAEGFKHKPLEETLANIKYCSKLDLSSFMAKRIKGKAFLKMRKFVLRFVKAVAHLNRAENRQDKSLIHTRTLQNLTQSTPDDLVIQTLLRSLTLDTIFLTAPRRKRTHGKAVNVSHRRALDKILKSKDLESLTLKRESIKSLLQQQDELHRLIKNLPNLKEFVLGVNFEYRTFWCPQLRPDIASRITSFHMRYKSSYSPVQEPKSPLFDFLDNIDAFKSLQSFRYEESDGIHWNHPEAANQLEKLEKFQNIPLKNFHMNLYFGGSPTPTIQQAMSGFFQNLCLPASLDQFSFYSRVQDLTLLEKISQSVPCFQTFRTLDQLHCFDLSIIANSMIVDFNLKEEQPEFLIQFFMKVLGNLHPGLQDLRLTALKTTKCHTQRVYQDTELLPTIANKFHVLNNLAIEFSDGAIELLCPLQGEVLPMLNTLSIDGCRLPLGFCKQLNPKEFKELVYNAPRGIDLESLVEVLDGVSRLKFLKKVKLMFAGCDKYDMRKEVFEGIVKILRDVEMLQEFTLCLDVHTKTNVLEWLLKFANLKKGLKFCRLNFYHYGAIKPLLITKEDYWIKSYMERTRRFLIN